MSQHDSLDLKLDDETLIARWNEHRRNCEACLNVDFEKPATLAQCCVVGAPYLKVALRHHAAPLWAAKAKKERILAAAQRGQNWCTASLMKRLMRYKE